MTDVLHEIEHADVALSVEAARLRGHPATRVMGALSELADQPPTFTLTALAALAGLALGRPRLARGALRGFAAAAVATAAKSAIKATVVRTRPYVLLDEGRYETGLSGEGTDGGPWHSFPSGHTANAVAVACAASRVAPEQAAPLALAALAVGVVQVPRGAHHALDVVAGALVGWASEAAVNAALDLVTEARPSAPRTARPARRA
jgi:membrane-associated phospholipid phosphatase